MNKAEREKRNQQIIDLRHQGKSQTDIAELLNMKVGTVGSICRKIGVGGHISTKLRDYSTLTNTLPQSQPDEQKAISQIKAIGGFDYIGGYTSVHGFVKLRCQICGAEFERSYETIRHQHLINCPECAKLRRAKEADDKRIQNEAVAIEKMMIAWRRKLERQKERAVSKEKTIHACPICGKPTDKRNCCSDQCQKTYANRTHEQRRRAKIRGALIDNDIQLMELFRRDNGVCHICGGECDLNDYVITEEGYTLTGGSYPSIDHVIPLAKGGKHSWDNVKLAHFSCNAKKHTKIMPPSSEKQAAS